MWHQFDGGVWWQNTELQTESQSREIKKCFSSEDCDGFASQQAIKHFSGSVPCDIIRVFRIHPFQLLTREFVNLLCFVLTNWTNLQSQPSGEGCRPESAWSSIKSTSSPLPPTWSINRKLSDCGYILHPSSRWLESSVTDDNHLHKDTDLSSAVTLLQLFLSVMKSPQP